MTDTIDFVYTWVNGESPEYQALLRHHSDKPVDLNPERFRDHYDLLKYSLRSAQRYAGWYGNVVLFTCRPQVPPWLNTEHPRLKIVHHDEVMDPEFLPTFNCNVIESYLHRIPTSSENFIYLNDDHLFGAPTVLEDFVDGGRIKILGTLFGERLPFRIFEERNVIFSTGLVEHTPMLLKKSCWEAMQIPHSKLVQRTRANRFRHRDDVKMDRLYRYYMLSQRETPVHAVPVWKLLRYHRFHKLTNNFKFQQKKLKKLKALAPKFYCLNDDQRGDPNPEVVHMVREFLEDYYPDKSEFER